MRLSATACPSETCPDCHAELTFCRAALTRTRAGHSIAVRIFHCGACQRVVEIETPLPSPSAPVRGPIEQRSG